MVSVLYTFSAQLFFNSFIECDNGIDNRGHEAPWIGNSVECCRTLCALLLVSTQGAKYIYMDNIRKYSFSSLSCGFRYAIASVSKVSTVSL